MRDFMTLVAGIVLGVLFSFVALFAQGQGGSEYPTVQFTSYDYSITYLDPSLSAATVGVIDPGQTVTLYTPYVGGDARWWAALNPERTEWVAVAINGYCPRERLGDVVPVMPK